VLLPEIVAVEMLAPLERLVPLAVMFSTLIVPEVRRKRGAVSAFVDVVSYLTLMFPVPMLVSACSAC
jgi:hypothetical protein